MSYSFYFYLTLIGINSIIYVNNYREGVDNLC